MTLAVARQPHYTDEAKLALAAWIESDPKLGEDFWYIASRLVGMIRVAEMAVSDDDAIATIWDDDEMPDLVLEVRRRSQVAVTELMQRNREVAVITIAGANYLASGGMSWGDPPTDACERIELIGYFDLFEEPITDVELTRALTTPLAECGTCHVQFPDIYPAARCPFEYDHPEGDTES